MLMLSLLVSCVPEVESSLAVWGCDVESESVVAATETPGLAPSAEAVVAELDGTVREVSFQGAQGDAFDVPPWSDVLSFSMALTGDVRSAVLAAPSNVSAGRASRCVEGGFLFADVEVGIDAEAFAGPRPGMLRWRGPDLDSDLWLVLEDDVFGGEVESDAWLSQLGEQLVQEEDCDPYDWVGIRSNDVSPAGAWENLELNVTVAGMGCWLTIANGAWIGEARL